MGALALPAMALPLGCAATKPINSYMGKVQILHAAAHEFPIGSTPQQVRERCAKLDISLGADQPRDGAIRGRLPTGFLHPFQLTEPVAVLIFLFDQTPALKGFEVEREAEGS